MGKKLNSCLSRNWFKTIFLIFALFLVSQSGHTQPSSDKPPLVDQSFYEITNTDITEIKDIEASSIKVLGVHLGMTIQKAKQLIARKRGVFFKQDKFNNHRLYLYDFERKNGKHIALGYFKWNHPDSGLVEIILYPGFSRYMEGKSKKLVSEEALNFEKGIGRTFLGYPLKKQNILHVPSQNIKHTAYYYKGKLYQIIKQVNGDKVKYSFGIFADKTKLARESQEY